MSHGEYRERRKSYKEERKIHKAQTWIDRRLHRFDRGQDELEAREALASRRQREMSVDKSPGLEGE